MIDYCAKEHQDIFAYKLCGDSGFYWDIGCNEPCACKGDWGNNTYSLEKNHGWKGLLFDVRGHYTNEQWGLKGRPNSKFFPIDATSDEFVEALKRETEVDCVDFISLDIDDNGLLTALENIFKTNIPFKTMTLEHSNDIGEKCKEESRTILNSKGYVALFLDVKFYPRPSEPGESGIFEDWWVNPSYFDEKIISASASGLLYDECVSRL